MPTDRGKSSGGKSSGGKSNGGKADAGKADAGKADAGKADRVKDPGTRSTRSKSVRGKRLGRYRLLEHLADGGMAEIFLARREEEAEGGFAKDLVLKVLQERYRDNAEVLAMFQAEASLSAGLNHPNIVDVHDVGDDDGVRFIAMEYIEGRTLTDLVTRSLEVGQALPLAHAVHIVAEVAAGLAYLDAGLPGRGRPPRIVHRDISPTNIVIGWAGQTKIIDFGIAQKLSDGPGLLGAADSAANPGAATRPGKVSYMSPEQVRGTTIDTRSDLFSLGTILYEITLGRRLWRGPAELVMRRIVEEAPAPPTYVQRDYPPALERIVLRALEKRPEDRQASAADMLADLDSFLAEMGVSRPSPRVLGDFVRGVFAPGARISEGGALRAQIFQDDDGAVPDPESAPLDFDRPVRPGSGAALAHALRSAQPFELAAEVTAVSAAFAGTPALGTGLPGGQPPQRTPPPMSLRTPPPVSLRNGATAGSAAAAAGSAAVPGLLAPAVAASLTAARSTNSGGTALSASGRGRAMLIALVLTILLGGIFFALRGS